MRPIRPCLGIPLAGSLLLALPVSPALAQPGPVSVPDTVVTASRIPTPEERVPAAITVITRRQIEERGYQTLAEALAEVPGLRIVQLGGPGQQSSGFLRGTGSRNVLVLLDGVPVNDVSEANGAFNFGQDLLFDVERIEVQRGPASSLYGSAAIGGVVNLVTRRAPPDRAFAPYGELAGGSQNTIRGGGGVTGTVGQVDYLLSGNALSTRGFNAVAPRFNANIPERDGFRGAASAARLGWTPLDGTRVEALLRWRENHFGLDSVPRDDPNYSARDRRWFGQLRGETQLFGGAWTTGLRLYATEDNRRYENLPDSLSASTTLDRYRGQRFGLDWGNVVRLPSFGGSLFTDAAVSFGLTHQGEESLSTAGSAFFRTTVDAAQHTTAGWTTLQFRTLDRLDVTAGLRHDATTGFTDATTWRLGAVLAVPELNSRVRAAGGTAFSAPSLFQRFGVIGGFFRGNPDLKPERSIGWEIGTETDIPGFGRERLATFGWTFFRTDVRQLINYNAAFDTLVNVDRARIHGAELGLTLRPAAWLEGNVAWTITEAFDARTDQRLPRRPEHVVSVTGRIAPLPRLTIAPTVLFTGRSPEGAFASYDNAGQSYPYARTNKSGQVFNLTATWQALEKINLFLEARNLGNARYEPANGFVVPGRSVLVGTRFAL